MPVGIRIIELEELQIAIDFTHEPWRSFALNMLRHFREELAELGLAVENQEVLTEIIYETKGDLQ
jgi:hypothetical protein